MIKDHAKPNFSLFFLSINYKLGPMKIYLIAGEASGDNIGSKLMRQLKLQHADIEFYGIGGEKMQAEGMNLLFPSSDLAVMGFFEILPHIFKFISKIKQTIKQIIQLQPDVVITIDSPGFSFRVAKAIKNKISGKLIHYVAPTVWAYRPERAKKIAQIYDHLLVILPFEPEYFLKEGLPTSFVGHPAIEDLTILPKENFRNKFNIAKEDLLLCLTPGSRSQEIKTLLPIFLASVDILRNKLQQNIIIAIPTALKDLVASYADENVIIIDEADKQSLFSSADLALTKSGTITTELAFYQIPMVIAHKVNRFSAWLLKKIIQVKFVTIVNLLANKELIPELLQERCNPEAIAEQLLLTFSAKEKWQQELTDNLAKLKVNEQLPSELAAKKILELI